ncbi:MAG: hypothetical protein LUD47_04625 [Clostridia bacterium]|nr:hypothetical protein [Clostridia bacterium]
MYRPKYTAADGLIIDRLLKVFLGKYPDTIVDFRKDSYSEDTRAIGPEDKHAICFVYRPSEYELLMTASDGKTYLLESDGDLEALAEETLKVYEAHLDELKEEMPESSRDGDESIVRSRRRNYYSRDLAEPDIASVPEPSPNRAEPEFVPRDVSLTFSELEEKYNGLLYELIQNIREIASVNLNEAGTTLLFGRLGIDCPRRGFESLAEEIGYTSGEATKLMRDIVEVFRGCEEERKPFTDRLSEVSLDEFTAYLLLIDEDIRLTPFFYDAYLGREYKKSTYKALQEMYGKKETERGGSKLYGERYYEVTRRILGQIMFGPKKRRLTDEEFGRLKKEREVKTFGDENYKVVDKHGNVAYCESDTQKSVYKDFMSYGVFKEVKMQSLRIPTKYYDIYPTFQCLTHEGYFVVVDVKPMIRMGEYTNIWRFRNIKSYCEKYGFGYLVIDGSYNSFYHIDEHAPKFEEDVISIIRENGEILYPDYKRLLVKYNLGERNTLSLIKRYDLKLTIPFKLQFESPGRVR